jgi:hypothetical protein
MRQQDGRWAERLRRIAADERVARHAGFWWGLAEGVAFFIVPDVYISAAALFSYRAGVVAWAASIAGSLVAVAVIRGLMLLPGVSYLASLDAVPGISAGMIERVSTAVGAGGLPWTPLLVLGGVPLKLYAAAAFASGLSLGAVLLWTVFARVARIAPTFLVAAAVRRLFRRRIDAHPGAWLVALVLFWLTFYAFYFQRMRGD